MKNYIRKRENMDITSLYHDIAAHAKYRRIDCRSVKHRSELV